ncbi:uracil-DNA glycosylase [Corynebacterium lujinxingii]|uniref:Uracil-DNA glycosylase n=1 Tax=Corynebacterium lujinxingii TaxID=2763010 RepID=A0A7H0K1L0_9CORY|nr:uracil-DNA glycosylase [Corynebacterium lujinxingii]MBC3178640.1 uracil-DNA glycosylase [Corynebacterium lujinxingii]NNO10430.1 uracil-DNA glycosylase [Corynebacterium lujinxingii]QNP91176.1 uracil-DNA glycosylase [Corynebacterium lujinxingii]
MLPVHESWQEPLAGVEDQIHAMGDFLRGEDAYLPRGNDILRAFADPFEDVRVLILGQDPYPTPGHPMGLAFSTQPGVAAPRSLVNIYRELHDDLGVPPRSDGDLSNWSKQGILLLNRVLTVRPGKPASHRGKGWEAVTQAAIEALVARDTPLVALLWGRDAQTAAKFLGSTPRIESPHPSPLSASRGFFGSRPFSRANEALEAQGAKPVDWSL